MTDTATARFGARQQSQGSNVNTWGDDKLNEVLRLFDRGSKGVQSLVITGDTALNWSNYAATNDGQCAILVLTGSLASPANLVVPSREWIWDVIKNATGQIVTVKTAAGAGTAIPNGRYAQIYCDGVDCYNGGPTEFAAGLTVAGKISGLTAGTAATDAVNKTQMETAIATANIPATPGTVLNSINDTTPGYLSQKIAEGTGINFVTRSDGANEDTQISVDTMELEEFLALTGKVTATITGGVTVMTDRRRYKVTGGTAMLPTMSAGSFSIVELAPASGMTITVGRNAQTIDGISADDTYVGDGGPSPAILYAYSNAGAVVSRLINGSPR